MVLIFLKRHTRLFVEPATWQELGRKTLVLELLFDNITGLQVWNFIKKRLQNWCFLKNIAKFLQTPILKNICECLLEFLLNQKQYVRWFLQGRFVDVVRVYFLLIISRDHSILFKDTIFTKYLRKTVPEICMYVFSISQSISVSLDKSVLLHCRWLVSKFPEISILVCRKIFSAFYLILH